MIYDSVIRELQSGGRKILTGHLDPDGDCIGSLLALYNAFGGKENGAVIVLEDEIPDNLYFLSGTGNIISPDKVDFVPEAVVFVDCAESSRASSGWLDRYLPAADIFVIDHHPVDSRLLKNVKPENIVLEPQAASVGEVVYRIIRAAGKTINEACAGQLYTAIASDTDFFRQVNTTSESLAICSELMKIGVDIERIRINLFESRSLVNIAFLAEALKGLEMHYDGRLVFMTVPYSLIKKYSAGKDDLRGMVNFTLSVRGAKMGVFFEERESEVKISLRSRKGYTVNDIAAAMGGGGHLCAAGAKFTGSAADAKRKILTLVDKSGRFLLRRENG